MPYTRKVIYNGKFDGRDVRAVMRPLSFVDALEAEATEVQPKSDSAEDKREAMLLTVVEIAKVLVPKLPSYVESLEGYVDSDGQPVPVDELCRVAYFAGEATQMAITLMNAANPGKVQGSPAASDS